MWLEAVEPPLLPQECESNKSLGFIFCFLGVVLLSIYLPYTLRERAHASDALFN